MIEDRLKETLDRVAGGGPDEAGAFDRFLRHRRASRSRRLAGATALVLVAALVSAVAVPRLLSDSAQPRLSSPGAAGPERWMTARWSPSPPSRGSRSRCRPAGRPARPGRGSSCGRPRRTSAATLPAPVQRSRASSPGARQPGPQRREGRHLPRTPPAARSCRKRSRAGPRATVGRQLPGGHPLVPGRPPGRTLADDPVAHLLAVPLPAGGALPGPARPAHPQGRLPGRRRHRRRRRGRRPGPGACGHGPPDRQRRHRGRRTRPGPTCVDGRSMALPARDRRLARAPPRTSRRWPISGGGQRTTATLVPCTVRGPLGLSSCWTSPAAGSTCRATAAP